MRFLAAGLLLLASCNSANTMQNDPKYRVLHSGDQAQRSDERRQASMVTTESAYRSSWAAIVGTDTPPPVDFNTESVLFLVSEQKSTGGYTIDVKGIAVDGNALVVDAGVQGPPGGSMVIQALTTPFAVVAVEKRDVTRVHWAE